MFGYNIQNAIDLHSIQDSDHEIVLNVYLLQVQSYLLQTKALIISRQTQHSHSCVFRLNSGRLQAQTRGSECVLKIKSYVWRLIVSGFLCERRGDDYIALFNVFMFHLSTLSMARILWSKIIGLSINY